MWAEPSGDLTQKIVGYGLQQLQFEYHHHCRKVILREFLLFLVPEQLAAEQCIIREQINAGTDKLKHTSSERIFLKSLLSIFNKPSSLESTSESSGSLDLAEELLESGSSSDSSTRGT